MAKEEGNKKILMKGFGVIFFPIVVWILISNIFTIAGIGNLNFLVFGLCFIAFFVALFYSFYILWAPKGIFTVIVQPSTVMIVGYNGRPIKILDEKGFMGGWNIVGIYPFHQILPITFEKWHSMEKTKDGFRLIEHPEKVVNFISTKKYSYASEVPDADTAVSRAFVRIPFIVVAQVKPENAIKFAFGVKNPISTVTSKIEVGLRNKVLHTRYDDLFHTEIETEVDGKKKQQSMIEFGQEVFDGLKDNPEDSIIKNYEDEFGLTTYSIGVLDLDPKDREANKRKFEAERTREARIIEANTDKDTMITRAEGQRIATETIATGNANAMSIEISSSMQTFCRMTHLSEEEVNFLIKFSPEEFMEKYGQIFYKCYEGVIMLLKANRKALFHLQTDGGNEGMGNLLNTIVGGTYAAGMIKDVLGNYQSQSPATPTNSPSPKTEKPKVDKSPKKESSNPSPSNGLKDEVIAAFEIMGCNPEEELEHYKTNDEFTEEGTKALIRAGIEIEEEKNLFK
ncbi:hypothetical protein M0R01_00290 [bacterium]|nr:hypothetical protein [bacterium]